MQPLGLEINAQGSEQAGSRALGTITVDHASILVGRRNQLEPACIIDLGHGRFSVARGARLTRLAHPGAVQAP